MSDYEDATELEFDGSLAQQDPFSSSQATERFSIGGCDTTIGAGDTTAIAPVSSSDDEGETEGADTTGAAGGEGGESGAGAREAEGAGGAGDTATTVRGASAADANTEGPEAEAAAEAMDEIPSDDDSRHEDEDEETEVQQGAPGHVALLLSQHLPPASSASTSASASTGGGTVASRVKDIRAIIDANHRSDKTNLRLDKSGGLLSLSQSSDASSSSSHQSQSSRKRASAPDATALVQGQSDARLVALLRTAADLATAAAADDAQRPPAGAPAPAVPSLAGLVQAVLAALPGRSSTEGGGGCSATSRRVLVHPTALDLLVATTPTNSTSGAGGQNYTQHADPYTYKCLNALIFTT